MIWRFPVLVLCRRTMATGSRANIQGADRIRGLDKSVWVEFTGLAKEYNACNLGQGFPDYAQPKFISDALAKASANTMMNQYTRSYGHVRLVQALAKLYSKLLEQEINPMTDILITVGAYNALFYAVFGLLNDGDEAIIIEPFYDCYEPMVRMAGGKPVFVPLRFVKPTGGVASSANLLLDFAELESKFSSKTKLFFFNNPQNPTGKLFNRDELMKIVSIVKKFPNVIVIADEVYEWLVYEGHEMIRFATLPEMYEKTITIGSAGKTFSMTGWKIGWAIGPNSILRHLQAVHQNCVYTCGTPLQEAIAETFELEMSRMGRPESYWRQLPAELKIKRDRLVRILETAGMVPLVPEAGYFLIADYSALKGPFEQPDGGGDPKDYRFVRWMTKEKKLATIPPTAFYNAEHKNLGENFVRFCFFKDDKTIDEAERILRTIHA